MKEDKKDQKMIIGLSHRSEDELDVVYKLTNPFSPQSVGLELPEDYQERESYEIFTFLFSDIAAHFRDRNVKVIPLEEPTQWDYSHSVDLAKLVREGKIPEKDLQGKLEYFERSIHSGFLPPEVIKAFNLMADSYKSAIEVLKQHPKLEDVMQLWEESIKACDTQMLNRILETNPDMCIVGTGHALKIKDALPNYAFYNVRDYIDGVRK